MIYEKDETVCHFRHEANGNKANGNEDNHNDENDNEDRAPCNLYKKASLT